MRTVLALLFCAALAAPALAQEVAISAGDTTPSVIAAQKGKRVTLRLRSGQEFTGTVREATARLVVLGALTGREFFDAVIPLEAVDAVIVRTRQ
jgi:hypothetical protein